MSEQDESTFPAEIPNQEETVPSEDAPDGVDIFVSYRVRPDEGLASELKNLLESSIEPKPHVFVSGLGGVRASAHSYREQLHRAAMKTRTYVGLITKASIDREWIFFEAGAAFGRRVLYAPILVDVFPGELPTSIGGYQGVMVRDVDRMRELIEDLAKELGARSKSHFVQRHARLVKAVDAYGKSEDEEERSGVPLAIHLAELGRRDEAERLFDDLLQSAISPEKKASIGLVKALFLRKAGRDMLEILENQPAEVKETAIYKLWLGGFETNPIKAKQLLFEASEGGLDGHDKRWVLTALARNEFELGHTASATARLVNCLSSDDRHLRGDAAQLLASQVDDENVLGRAILLAVATLDPTYEHFLEAATYCWEKGLTVLALHMAEMCVAKRADSGSHLSRGLARSLAGLKSLAFSDFRASARGGESVAKSNMAGLLRAGPVPEAALEILREHEGDFNCADPGHPYEIRTLLERALQEERKTETALRACGERITTAIHRLVEASLHLGTKEQFGSGRWRAGRIQEWLLTVENGEPSVVLDGQKLSVRAAEPFTQFYVAFHGTEARLLFILSTDPEAVALPGLTKPDKLEWLQFVHQNS